ncbi:MAG: alpha/beta hydrolase [Thermoguttaceae bacterium]
MRGMRCHLSRAVAIAHVATRLLLVILSLQAVAVGADAPRIWLLSTRCVDGFRNARDATAQIEYWRIGQCGDQQPADAEEFRSCDSVEMPTVVFVHGNNTAASEAVTKGLYVYASICSQVGDKPFRFVIWSWPADRLRRIAGNTRMKAVQCDVESYYLAAWLDGLRPGTKVCLVGHSFGPRIIAGALHLLGGGELACRRLPEKTVAAWAGGKRNPLRAVLLAGALDADWLAAGSRNGRALSLSDQVLITCNEGDRVLRWYPHLWSRHGPQALGLVGPCGLDAADNVEVVDVRGAVGRIHDWRGYASASEVCCRWAHYTFLEETPSPP